MVHSQGSLSQGREAHSLMEVDLMRRLISQSTVQPLPIVEFEVPRQSFSGVLNNPVFLEVDLFVFHRPPQPLYKDVVVHPTSTIHADPDLRRYQLPKKLRAGKLHPLVRVEDSRLRDDQRSLQRPDTKLRIGCYLADYSEGEGGDYFRIG